MLKSKLPSLKEALPVFGVFVFFGYSWALYRLFWYVPGWLEYLSVWKVLTISAYVLAFGLLESLFMMGGLVVFSLFFPRRIFREKFIHIGSSLAFLLSIAAILLQRKINLVYRLELWQLLVYPLVFLIGMIAVVLAFAWFFDRYPDLGRRASDLSERVSIFVYFYVPLSLVGGFVVLFRNILGS